MYVEGHAQDTYKSLLSISDSAFKYLGSMNGATWLSVLVLSDKIPDSLTSAATLRTAITCFIVSLALTGFCYLFAYLTQLSLHNENLGDLKKGRHAWFLWSTILMYAAGVAVYFWGAYKTVGAFFG